MSRLPDTCAYVYCFLGKVWRVSIALSSLIFFSHKHLKRGDFVQLGKLFLNRWHEMALVLIILQHTDSQPVSLALKPVNGGKDERGNEVD